MMAGFLWGYWRYLGGKGWPRSTAVTRRSSLRVSRLSESAWGWSLTAGVLGVASAVNLQMVYGRFVHLPSDPAQDFSRYPSLTVVCALLMGAAVAGFMEEAGFRGYMQVPLERRYGPIVASITVGILFGMAHFSHGIAQTIPLLPYYFAISVIYSAIAYLSNSLLPVVAIHASGDALEFLYAWLHGASPLKPAGEQSEVAFGVHLISGLLLGALAIGAYRQLAAVAHRKRGPDPGNGMEDTASTGDMA